MSCNPLEENSRPATEVNPAHSGGQTTGSAAPAYITPPCNISNRHTSSDLGNFQLSYNLQSTIALNNDLLHYQVENNTNDIIDLYVYPFVENKNTVYTLTSSSSALKNYQGFIKVNGNALDLYDKFLATTMSSPLSYIYQEYDPGSGTYTLRFCDALFSYDFLGSTHTSHISGSFSFIN